MNKRRIQLINAIFFIIHLLTAIGFIRRNQFDFIFNPALTSSVYLGVLLLERYTIFKLNGYTRLLLILNLVGHTLLGEYYNLYNLSKTFDKFLHFSGCFAFGLFAYSLVKTFIKVSPSRPFIFSLILAASLGTSLGTLLEIAEFTLDVFFDQFNQRSLLDTNLDLLADLIGSLLAGFVVARKIPMR